MRDIRKIGVWNTAFLGDAVLTLPLLRTLRAAWPSAEIDFYVRGGVASLFSGQPEIDRVIAYDKRGNAKGMAGFWRLGRDVTAQKYDLWIDTHLSLRSSLMALFSRAKHRVGYTEASLSRLIFSHSVQRRFYEQQEIERLLGLLEPLAISEEILAEKSLRWPELVLPLSAHAEANALLHSLPPGPILGVNPGSVWPTKRWTTRGFAQVMALALQSGAHVVMLAAPNERETAAEVLALLSQIQHDGITQASGPTRTSFAKRREGVLLDLSGQTSLPVLAAVIGRLQCYLTNDSGPMHLAWAQRTPVTALFGPTVHGLGFAPRGNSTIMEVNEPCRPCGLHGHKVCPQKHFRCMKSIVSDDVWHDVYTKLYPWQQDVALRQDNSTERCEEEYYRDLQPEQLILSNREATDFVLSDKHGDA